MDSLIAYKILNHDDTCRGFKYEIGQTYEMNDKPVLCQTGFHACFFMQRCFDYYSPNQRNKFVEVLLLGDIVGNKEEKYCSNKIKIIRELSFLEMIDVIKKQTLTKNGNNHSDGNNCLGNF